MDGSEKKLKLYEMYLNDLGRVGGQHETARQFYIGVITAISGFLTLAGKDGSFTPIAPWVGIIASVVGVAICILWIKHMRSFSTLFTVKTKIIRQMETTFDTKPFTDEHNDDEMTSRTRLTTIDQRTAGAFIVLFILVGVACLVFWLWKTVSGSAPPH